MTIMREKAINLIGRVPEKKLYYVLQFLEGIEGLSDAKISAGGAKTPEQLAFEDLQRFRRPGNEDFDYKAELANARDEKYANTY